MLGERPTSKHKAAPDFWYYYRQLPEEIQKLADKNFELLDRDLRHPSLQFKKVGNVWSARVGLDFRALAIDIPEGFLWFWIGNHAEYDRKNK
jgi:hypothetical protein